jgi:5-methylcytosine-specific restriction enzyme A
VVGITISRHYKSDLSQRTGYSIRNAAQSTTLLHKPGKTDKVLSEITAAGVDSAITEFDRVGRQAFLTKYQFRPSRTYFLVNGGRDYDSKAICGAARGYDRPDLGPMAPADFSGGDATVRRTLNALGFEVRSNAAETSSGWTAEERVLALHLYLTRGTLNRAHPAVIALSDELNRRAFHSDAGTRPNFRNPSGVVLKLANFAALDPGYGGAGMSRTSLGDVETWATYSGDFDVLPQQCRKIGQEKISSLPTLPHIP